MWVATGRTVSRGQPVTPAAAACNSYQTVRFCTTIQADGTDVGVCVAMQDELAAALPVLAQ